MLYLVFITLILINVFLFKEKNQTSRVFLIITFIFMWILLGWSSGGNDVNNTMIRYLYPERYSSYTEFIYDYLIVFSKKLGFSFRQFNVIISACELFFLYKFFDKHCDYPNLTAGFFILYPMAYIFTLQRFFIAFTIILCGCIDSILDKKRGYLLRFVFWGIIAMFIHYSCGFYFLYLLVNYISIKKTWIITIIGSVVLSGATAFSFVTSFFAEHIDSSKMEHVLAYQQGQGLLGRTILMLIVAIQFFAVYYLNNNETKENPQYELILKINIISLLSITLTNYYSFAFSRMYVANLLIYYVFYCNVIGKFSWKHMTKKQLISLLIIILSTLLLIYLVYRNETMRNISLRPMFEQNELIN